ncbi:MAG: single-stranded DNA-binding protein [Chloracidobacterium sp.]|nr:single-stranded DNA-binding protein [Chloracidobacterium sp.]
MSFNKIILVGNLGKDPELRYTPQGDAVCSFSMATNERKKDKSGEFQDVTTWFKVTLWRRQAENASKYLSKGSSVYIEGRLQMEEWTDRDGKERFTLGVQATDMQFIGSRGDGGGGGGGEYSGGGHQDDQDTHSGPPVERSSGASSGGASSAPVAAPAAADDDIPF